MSEEVEVRPLGSAERELALAHLAGSARDNLLLLDLAGRVGAPPAPGELPAEMIVAWRNGRIASLAALRPSLVLESEVEPEVLEAMFPYLGTLGLGLLKSPLPSADALWEHLSREHRRRAVVDRTETAYAVGPDAAQLIAPRRGERVRHATRADLEELVVAARESLREESRPDPFAGDPRGFRRWVRGRVPHASVVESGGRIVFAGYADVRRPEGWLLQGVYTWPDVRRRGFAAIGVSALCEEAFAAGADHVQLAVVDGNDPGRRLYEGLGFEPFAQLRTILFT